MPLPAINSARLDRRTVLTGSTAAVAATLLTRATARAEHPVFQHGLASGDPLPDRVILWTRVTPSAAATPGSGVGEPVRVRWEVATDEGFGTVVASGTHTATADSDHTVKVDVSGLAAGRDYRYRFTALDQTSPIGRTRTAPATGDAPDRLRFGVVSCANWEAGFFSAYRHLTVRTDLDAVVHLGDYLYEYEAGEYGGRLGSARRHEPAHEIVSLADYRIRHAQYKTDPDLTNLHATLPFICIWDDHETANDAWAGGAENHTPGAEGDWQQRRAAALQAYLEWMPVRAGADGRLYRRLRFGTLAELSMLDLRSYRTQQVQAGPGWRQVDAPDRSITGPAQMDWVTNGLVSAPVTWKLVGNPVMIAPLVFPPLDPATTAALTQLIGIPEGGIPANLDQWDGYTADRKRLLTAITDNQVGDVVFLTGDIHSSWAADLPLDAATYPASPTAGAEFVVPSVTSQSVGDIMRTPPRTVSVAAEGALQSVNRHLRYVEVDSHGYGVLHVDAEQAQMDWFYVGDVADPNTGVRHGASFAVRRGGRVEPRSAPLLD
ncbi:MULTISPECIES: alkaline phosphatase D family protein [unclassified Nocardia]|uniref:alkaline phosphatase D family protein n=1 Tax=unclassified Nocardia TaxID=2637762 RepID=UPI0024A7E32D|nr:MULTISPECIES: alkaline phosphatase D family protein [unclassified Nocardia]